MSIMFRPSQFPLTKAELNETEVIEIHLQDEDVLSILPDADCIRIPNRQKKTNSLDMDILANRVHVVESCLIQNDKENQRRDRALEELVKSLTVMREQEFASFRGALELMTEENKKRDERQEIRDQRLEEVLKQNTTILCDTVKQCAVRPLAEVEDDNGNVEEHPSSATGQNQLNSNACDRVQTRNRRSVNDKLDRRPIGSPIEDVMIHPSDETIKIWSQSFSLTVFVRQLLFASFPDGYFQSHTAGAITKHQLKKLYDITSQRFQVPSERDFKTLIQKKVTSYRCRKQKSAGKSTNIKRRQTDTNEASDLALVPLTKSHLDVLKEGVSCVGFIHRLVVRAFPTNYFRTHMYRDVSSATINLIYDMTAMRYKEIKNGNNRSVPLTMEEFVLVFRAKVKSLRAQLMRR